MSDEPESAPDSALAQDLIERFPGLKPKQYLVLGACCVRPTVPWAARAAGISNVAVYQWLGRTNNNRRDEAFCAAWEVCSQIGAEAVFSEGLDMAMTWCDGRPAAPRIMNEIIRAWGPSAFRTQGVDIRADTTVKRVILERE